MGVHMFTVFQAVNRRAVRALGLARAGHIQKHLGMGVPGLHTGHGAGAKHAAVAVQVSRFEFNGLCFSVHVIKPPSTNARISGCVH